MDRTLKISLELYYSDSTEVNVFCGQKFTFLINKILNQTFTIASHLKPLSESHSNPKFTSIRFKKIMQNQGVFKGFLHRGLI